MLKYVEHEPENVGGEDEDWDGDDGDDDDDLDDENLTFTLEMFNSCQPALSQQRGICLTCAFF